MRKQNEELRQNNTSPFPKMEEEVLNFWDKAGIFEKSVEKEAPRGDYVFYDGPPFATGEPHYGHIVASCIKDVVPRYWTMRGCRVERKWGWDCHGLPIENIAEKELGITRKKEIEVMGVEKFNEFCRSKVLTYVDIWEKVIRRLGRWADMKNAYRTMDLAYMESIWWVFKQLWDKGLVYEDYRVIHICTRCETTLSQSEVSEGYKSVKDLSVVVKFPIKDQEFLNKVCNGLPASFLAWTTTPWSIPTTMGLAVGAEHAYILAEIEKEQFIFAKNRLEYILKFKKDLPFKIIKELKGSDVAGVNYEHPFGDIYGNHEKVKNNKNVFKTHVTDYVSTEDGTGLVTINGAFGDIDMQSAMKIGLPVIVNVKMDGSFTEEMGEFAGMNVKSIDDTQKTDVEIIKYLARNNFLFAKEKYEHSYPHCWRCETPLINYATTSWFVNVTKIKTRALELAGRIEWFPGYLKEGRFGNWLEGARDWSISRQRYWASVMPIWKCEKCGETKVFGSVADLEKTGGVKVTDLHKHVVDKITFACACGGEMKRVPDVLDTWFDSGSMPYGEMHYPFENKRKFEDNFPAEFIAEGIDQTRAWFYYLHILGAAILDSNAFRNVIANGIVLAEDGKKMSKRLKNYPNPAVIFDKYGADAMRFYLMSSPVVAANNLNFSEAGVKEALQKNIMILWNVYKFYELFTNEREFKTNLNESPDNATANILDQWILARLNQLIKEVTESMNKYNLPRATRPITDFINDFSTWYLRRSRDRFKSDDEADKQAAMKTTGYVLLQLSKIMAPFMPFMAERIWQSVKGYGFKDENKSVHLSSWVEYDDTMEAEDVQVLKQMAEVRKIVELGLAARDEAGIKVRQPLNKFSIFNFQFSIKEEYLNLIKDELNVREVVVKKGEGELRVELDVEITDKLKLEGLKREIVRLVNAMRKNAGLTVKDKIVLSWQSEAENIKKVFEKLGEELKKDTLSEEIVEGAGENEVKVNGESVKLGIRKI